MNKKKFKIYTLGCKINQYDSGNIGSLLSRSGFVQTEKDADLVIVNTCTVTMAAVNKDKKTIRRAIKENPLAKIVLMGCMVKSYNDEVGKIPNIDVVWGVGEHEKLLVEIFKTLNIDISVNKCSLPFCQSENTVLNKSRYFIKVQDGCEQFCSYCVIPYNRGMLKSRPVFEIINEIKQAVFEGYEEIVLSGIHLGLYGINTLNNKRTKFSSLAVLIKEVLKVEGLGRVRLSSIEVTEVSDELIELMTDTKKICRHLHISMQSGCDKILNAMNRPYTKEYFKDRVEKIRSIIPDISITTDVIVGFPGETEADFEETCDYIKEINFSKVHVFSFSAHEKTPAYKMNNKVGHKEITMRSEKLRMISEKLEEDFKKKFKGKVLPVLIQGVMNNKIKAKTEYYFDMIIDLNKIKKENFSWQIKKIIPIKFDF